MRLTGFVFVLAGALSAGAAFADYTPGFVWNRLADWSGGTQDNFAWQAGNPDDDAAGNRAWSYEYVYSSSFGDLNGPNPWYLELPNLMVWDSSWFGTNTPLWVVADDTRPIIAPTLLFHSVEVIEESWAVPMVRWKNPTTRNVTVGIKGNLKLTWDGNQNLEVPIDCDVVVLVETQDHQFKKLLAQRYSDPSPGDQNIGVRTIPIDLPGVKIKQGESVLISMRGVSLELGRYFYMEDDLNITLTDIETGGGCVPDMNGDGVLDLFDFLEFVNLFNAGC